MNSLLTRSPVTFDEFAHTYTMPDGTELSGITSILHRQLFPAKYSDIPEAVLQRAAAYGSNIHERIECADALDIPDGSDPIVDTYRRIKAEHGLVTVANEYLVSDEMYVASSIDIVFEGWHLCDIKTTSTLDRDYVSWQLSIYAYLFELQNPGLKAGRLFALWMPKPQYGEPALVEVPRISSELCASLILTDALGVQFERPDLPARTEQQLPAKVQQAVDAVIDVEYSLRQLKEKEQQMRDGLLDLMLRYGIDKYSTDELTLTVKKATTRTSLDSKKLKESYPEAYNDCLKTTPIAESLLIKIK